MNDNKRENYELYSFIEMKRLKLGETVIGLKIKRHQEKIKIIVIIVLLSVSWFLTYYFYFILKIKIVFSHFFYIPIILACLWWKKKGLIVPLFLAGLLIIFPFFLELNVFIINDIDIFIRAFLLLFIGIIVSILREQISKTEKNLEESEEKYRTILENIKEGYFEVDLKGNFTFLNNSFCKILGYPSSELIGNNFNQFVDKELKQIIFNQYNKIYKTKAKQGLIQLKLMKKNREKIFIENSVYLRYDSEGEKVGFCGIARDITEMKKVEQKLKDSEKNLRKLNQELEKKVEERTRKLKKSKKKYRKAYNRANFYKDLFVHDINNIINNIQLSIQLFSLYYNDPEKLKDINKILNLIREQAIRGAKLVSNVQKLSQLEETEIFIESIEVCKVLKDTINFVIKSFQTRNINISVDTFGKKLYVQANDLLIDVFENILINAVKYNNNPIVEILIKISKKQKEGINYLKLEFIDNGIGITDDKKKIIFKKAYKKDNSVKGMGFGLSLVKKIIDGYNGQIWVEDKVKGDYSKGSNFIILISEVL